jgi:hypothetical protein
MSKQSPFDMTPEQKAELAIFYANNVANGTARPRICETTIEPAPVAKPELSQEAKDWYASNPWATVQPARFTRTHFRPSVLRRR